MTAVGPRFSVVVPAHDEAGVIERCLAAFTGDLASGEAEVVVVVNGSTDETAAIARRFPGVGVVELAEASKVAALNAGDAAVSAFPRVFLDADIEVSARTLRRLVAALPDGVPRVGAPTAVFDADGAARSVRAFYRVFRQLPYAAETMTGTGVYALSRAGRERFDVFPDLTADDLFVQRLFGPDERVVVEGSFIVRVPRSLSALVRVRTRVASGNRELAGHPADVGSGSTSSTADANTTTTTAKALATLARSSPAMIPSVLVYGGVAAAARVRARRAGAGPTGWLRDQTTRGQG